MEGYAGQILRVDLTAGTCERWAPPAALYHAYVGGSGIAARLLWEALLDRPDMDPFDPANPLIIMTGPATGTTLPGSNRFVTCALSPLTGLWGESNCGGYFGPWLRRAGLDGVVVVGQAAAPVYLVIDEAGAELHTAADLWGRDSYETSDILGARHSSAGPGAQVFAIGQAGERLVRFAAIVNNKAHFAGRTGMGAVMGSKRLKAIVCQGAARPHVADPAGIRAITLAVNARLRDSLVMQALREVGTAAEIELKMYTGDIPSRNWTLGSWLDAVDTLGGTAMAETILVDTKTCYACQVRCKRVVEVPRNPFNVRRGAGPEFEACVTFGSLILNSDLAAVAAANDLCNRAGMDTISAGATIALAYECWERGLIDSAETDGLELRWGDGAAAVALLAMIAERRGLGDLLAEGSQRFAHGRPGAAVGLTTVKGLEAPMHDPRATAALGLAYATSPIGASHMQGLVYTVTSGQVFYPDVAGLGPAAVDDPLSPMGKAQLVASAQNLDQIMGQALALCHFAGAMFSEHDLAAALTALVGRPIDLAELLHLGNRIWNLKRAIGWLRGARAADDQLPARLLGPLLDGPVAGQRPDLAGMLAELYALRELDAQGRPTAALLSRLGLADVAAVLHDLSA